MITNTFTFIPGIGKKTEEYLWRDGILTWDDLESKISLSHINRVKNRIIKGYLQAARKSLKKGNVSFFARHLAQQEYWRLYKNFQDKCLFLDIETTGLSLYYDVITLIGTFDGYNIKIFIKDNNLNEIIDHLKNYEILVTFNGKLFDVPFIKKKFPELCLPPIHIDLRYLLRKLGFTGPLKEIEKNLGIRREKSTREISGREAVLLWSRFVRGDDEALRKLVLYNIHDTMNLKYIVEFCYQKKVESNVLPKINGDYRQRKLFETSARKVPAHLLSSSNFILPNITIHKHKHQLKILRDSNTLLKIKRNKIRRITVKIDDLIKKIINKGYRPLAVGIDLSGSEKRTSGISILQGEKAYLSMARTDKEIISKTINAKPEIISIDSPLSLPKGRCCANDTCECRKYGIIRECERILKRRGINVYPCLINSMQKLTTRGIKLSTIFRKQGYAVIESYPGAAQDILRFPRKRINLTELEIDLTNTGIKPFSNREIITHDEIDALTSALVGYFYLVGEYEAIGSIEENYLIVPKINE